MNFKMIYNNLINPRYRIMQGIKIENRAIMFLGAYPIVPRDRADEIRIHGYYDEEYDKMKISFKNTNLTYWRSNTYKRIYTFKQLIYWVRLLSDGKRCSNSKCLEYKNFRWNKILKG